MTISFKQLSENALGVFHIIALLPLNAVAQPAIVKAVLRAGSYVGSDIVSKDANMVRPTSVQVNPNFQVMVTGPTNSFVKILELPFDIRVIV